MYLGEKLVDQNENEYDMVGILKGTSKMTKSLRRFGINTSYFRTEIAILQEDINSQSPGIHKFKIPILSTEDTVGTVYTPMNNRANKNILKSTVAKTVFDNTINLRVPKEHTVFYGADIIPKGTRFIVTFVGGNVNDIKIIGRYDNIEDMEADK